MWPALFLTSNHSHIRQLQFATQAFSQKVLQQAVQISICQWVEYGCVSLCMRFFPQNFGTIKRILPGSSSPSYREGPGTEVG